jgi:REP element-mobilizing transposase RayT
MSTYTQILYHLVYGTKNRTSSLDLEKHDQLCKYIAGLLKNKKCVPHKIGGYSDHIHILLNLHPSVALSEIVKDIKLASSDWIKKENLFPDFEGWQDGYGAFTCSWSMKDEVSKYIDNQFEHHKQYSFKEEYIGFLKRAGIEFDEKYLI